MAETKKNLEALLRGIATVEAYALSVSDLMGESVRDHFENTLEGAIKRYEESAKCDEHEAAYRWMNDHYDSITAAVRAAMYLSEATYELAQQLWNSLYWQQKEGEVNGKA